MSIDVDITASIEDDAIEYVIDNCVDRDFIRGLIDADDIGAASEDYVDERVTDFQKEVSDAMDTMENSMDAASQRLTALEKAAFPSYPDRPAMASETDDLRTTLDAALARIDALESVIGLLRSALS